MMMETGKANYKLATEKAYEIIIYNNSCFPIDLYNLKIIDYKIKIISMQDYSKKTGVGINELTQNGLYEDGYICIEEDKKRATIIYNENIETATRKRFTIAHEIGHIVMHHKGYDLKNEQEADTFASQLLMPHCILEKLIHLGKNVTPQYLNSKFGLSVEAAKISLQHVGKKMNYESQNEYEDIIIQMNKQFLEDETRGLKYKYYEEDDEMQKERDTWI